LIWLNIRRDAAPNPSKVQASMMVLNPPYIIRFTSSGFSEEG